MTRFAPRVSPRVGTADPATPDYIEHEFSFLPERARYFSSSGDDLLAVAWRDRDEEDRPARLIASGVGSGGSTLL